MNKGKIVFLNGVTSSGKTSILEAIQLRSDILYRLLKCFARWTSAVNEIFNAGIERKISRRGSTRLWRKT
ncbi:phosphotransferase-like protein [Paenibacillus gorillae]|uniref:phosphotransferase-like protein n=1 Tax=Paenibacillus gorillae TaxID=1243662 RepID=UPI0004B0AD4E